jgi:signal transduction histidine kinase/ActR/RegA family two-component response regulator
LFSFAILKQCATLRMGQIDMEPSDCQEKDWCAELARLEAEMEQGRVAQEDAQAEIAALIGEREQLRRTVAALDRSRAETERELIRVRGQAADATALIANALHQTGPTEDLRTVLEETSVLAEELQAANEELLAANEELDQRVAERTLALGAVNAELERVNAELHRRVEAETAARLKAQAELFQMQKLEAIGQLTGGIAHDFNNLLMVIINGLQVLAEPTAERQRERALRRTQEASWRAAELTRRLLAFARRQALQPERIDMSQHVEGLRELLGQGLRENIQLRLVAGPDVWPLEADIGALELALLNLAVNSRDAMPNGGCLTIAARNVVIDVAAAARLSLAPGEYVEIAVQDTGVGMPPEVAEKVFEPFFTTKNAGQGTGLGLSQVYGFAQQSGGTASLESRQGEGTVVRLLLPRSHRAVEAQPRARLVVAPPPQHGNLSVLVVEDEPAVAAMVVDMLEQLGHHDRAVSTVAGAIAVLSELGFDLILTDVLLPGGASGLDLAREVRQRRLDVPVILTSGYGGSMTERLSAANLPFLRKPYRLDTLSRAIEAALSMRPARVQAD